MSWEAIVTLRDNRPETARDLAQRAVELGQTTQPCGVLLRSLIAIWPTTRMRTLRQTARSLAIQEMLERISSKLMLSMQSK